MIYAYKRYTNMEAPINPIGRSYLDGDKLCLIYMGMVEAADAMDACERLFVRHNADDRPDGRLGPSLSVGDVVVLRCDNGSDFIEAMFCDNLGFKPCPMPMHDNIDSRFWLDIVKERV